MTRLPCMHIPKLPNVEIRDTRTLMGRGAFAPAMGQDYVLTYRSGGPKVQFSAAFGVR